MQVCMWYDGERVLFETEANCPEQTLSSESDIVISCINKGVTPHFHCSLNCHCRLSVVDWTLF